MKPPVPISFEEYRVQLIESKIWIKKRSEKP